MQNFIFVYKAMFYSDRHCTGIVVCCHSINFQQKRGYWIGVYAPFLILTSPSDAVMMWSWLLKSLVRRKKVPPAIYVNVRICAYISHVFRNLYGEDIFYTCPSSDTFTLVTCNLWLWRRAAKYYIHQNSPCYFSAKHINMPLYMKYLKMIGNSNIF